MSINSKQSDGWVGWIGFAGIILYLAGFFHLIEGFAALFNDTLFIAGPESIWAVDITQWGWIHILGGILLIAAGSSLVTGHMYGRVIAIFVALLSAIANMFFIPIYPIWSLLIIALNIIVIYAVVVHGSDLKNKTTVI